ncbi:MAG: lysophospholipid acyltransferase family protein [Gammaproteobacteria bacterium]
MILWKCFSKLFVCIGFERMRRLCKPIIWLMLKLNSKPVRTIRLNLQTVFPDEKPETIEKYVYQAMHHLGEYLGETLYAWSAVDEISGYCEQIEGLEYLARALNQGTGVLCMTPHCGCTELATIAMTDLVGDSLAMYRKFSYPSSEAISDVRFGRRCTAVAHDNAGLRSAARHLKRKGIVLMAADTPPKYPLLKDDSMPHAKLMGIAVNPNTVPGRLVDSSQVKVLYYCGIRTATGFKVQIFEPDPAFPPSDPNASAQALYTNISRINRLCISQVHWFHRFFTSNETMCWKYRAL